MKSQAVFLIGSRVGAAAFQALLFVLFARDSPPTDFGRVATIINVATLLVMLVTFATAQVVLREHAAQETARVDDAISLGVATSAVVGSSAALAAAIALVIGGPSSWTAVSSLVVLGLIFDKNAEVRTAYLVAEGQRLPPALNLIERRAAAVVAYIVAADVADLRPVLAIGVAYVVAGWIGVVESWLRTRHALRWRPDGWKGLARASRVAAPYLSNNLTSQARTLDVAIVTTLAGPTQAGIYSAAYRIASPMLLVTTGVATALVPHAVRMTTSQARSASTKLAIYHLVAAAALVPASWLCAPAVPLLLGRGYAGAAPVLPPLIAGILIVGLSTLFGSILQAQGRADLVAKAGIVSLFFLGIVVAVASALGGAVTVAWAVALVFSFKAIWMLRATRLLKEAPFEYRQDYDVV